MSYALKYIRNICLLGHGGNGKTSLAESMLYLTELQTVDVSSTETRWAIRTRGDPRQISISAATMYTEYKKNKINIIDTPGYFELSAKFIRRCALPTPVSSLYPQGRF
jgi:elongation factor G